MSLLQLQKEIQTLNDQINDILHATELNFAAITLQLSGGEDDMGKNNRDSNRRDPSKNATGNTHTRLPLVVNCMHQFENLKNLLKERSSLRLQYLMNQQVKSEEEKVRRQRLLQYEDKIYDHRRLICDKEAFYDSLLKPKPKRPPGMTTDQFQELRLKQIQQEERQNFQQLEEQTQILLKLQKIFREHRLLLEKEYQKFKSCKEIKSSTGIAQESSSNLNHNQKINISLDQSKKNVTIEKDTHGNVPQGKIKTDQSKDKQKQKNSDKNALQGQKQTVIIEQKPQDQKDRLSKLISLANSVPTLHQSQCPQFSSKCIQESKQLISQLFDISTNQKQLYKEYKEQKQMYTYLKWQQADLVKKYQQLSKEIQQLRQQQMSPNSKNSNLRQNPSLDLKKAKRPAFGK